MEKKLLITLLILIMFVFNGQTVKAMPKLFGIPEPSFNIYPYNNHNIKLVHEELEYDISKEENLQNQASYINQDYKLQNVGNKREEILAAIVMIGHEDTENLEINLNGRKQEVIRVKLDGVSFIGNGFTKLDAQYHEEILGSNFKFDDIVEPINNKLGKSDETKELSSIPRYGEVNLMIVKFVFEPNSTNSLQISQRVISGFSKNRSGTRIKYMYEHQIDPAKYWDSFGDLDVTIKLPSNLKLDSSEEENLLNNVNNVGEGIYKKHFSSLPLEKIAFAVSPKTNVDNESALVIASIIIVSMLAIVIILIIVLRLVKQN